MKRWFYLSGTLCFLVVTLAVGIHLGRATSEASSGPEIAGIHRHRSSGIEFVTVVTRDGTIYTNALHLVGVTRMKEWGNVWEGTGAAR